MRILADENVDRPIVQWLRELGHEVLEIATFAPGATDDTVVQLSRDQDRVLITFDRDIGNIVRSQGGAHPGVVYLRLTGVGPALWESFRRIWPDVQPVAPGRFVTVRDTQIRTRPLPMEGQP